MFLADLEDSSSPTWRNVVEGQVNLRDAVEGSIDYAAPDTKKRQRLRNRTAVLMVRPRGWHLVEKHVLVDASPSPPRSGTSESSSRATQRGSSRGAPARTSAARSSRATSRRGSGTRCSRSWRSGSASRAAIKATRLVETLPAAFEMNEILWELRERSAGLGFSRWDYVASTIKRLRGDPS